MLSGTALAADAYDGYLVRMEQTVSLFSERTTLPEGVEEIHAPAGLYKIQDAELADLLLQEGLASYAEPNYIVTLFDAPEEPAYLEGKQWNLDAMGMDYAWTKNITGAGVRVGVIDSGIFSAHEDFTGTTIVEGINYCVKEESPQRTDTGDVVGHGTFVSGIIAAAGNGVGTAGMAPGVELVPLKCFSNTSSTVAQIAEAIYDAVDVYQCRVLNMSFGLPRDHSALREAIEYAAEKGTVMVAAVGNLRTGTVSSGNDTLQYPAAYDCVIGVGAADQSGSAAAFSYQNDSVFLTAPGASLWGLDHEDATSYKAGEGTSYAAPAVSAAVALAIGLQPEVTVDRLTGFLAETAGDQGDPGWDRANGWGFLQISPFLAAVDLMHQTETFLKPLYETESLQATVITYDECGRMEQVRLFHMEETVDYGFILDNLKTCKRVQLLLMDIQSDWIPFCAAKELVFLPKER